MTTFEIIKSLAKKRNMNMKQAAVAIGFSENAFYKWKTSSPSVENLEKVANYFGVSTDYLLGREEAKPKQVDINDDTVIMTFSGKELSEEDRALVLATTRAILEQRNKNK